MSEDVYNENIEQFNDVPSDDYNFMSYRHQGEQLSSNGNTVMNDKND